MAYMVTEKTTILHKGKIFYPGSVIEDDIAKQMSIENLEKSGQIAKVKDVQIKNETVNKKTEKKTYNKKPEVPKFVNEIKTNFNEEKESDW